MPLYRIADQKLSALRQTPIVKEKDLQKLVEANLFELLDVHFLETEYSTTSGGRIDTLGVDRNGAPVIIEYKRNQNDNVINQALSYRKWLTAQKSEFFEMLMIKKLSKDTADSIEIDWKRPRIICIAESFSRYDTDTADVISSVFRVELMTYRAYEDNIFGLELLPMEGQRLSSGTAGPTSVINQENSITEYSVEGHRERGSAEVQALFDDLRSRVLALGPQVVERAVKLYIAYRASKVFLEIHVQKSAIRTYLRPIDYYDPENRAIKIPDSRNWTLDRQVNISDPSDLDYVMRLIEQSYNNVI